MIGAGADIALNDRWSARVEYLFIDYASRDVAFPVAAQHFDSSLTLQTIRLGLDYKIGEKAIDYDFFTKTSQHPSLIEFAFHGQTTFIEQYAARFSRPISGRRVFRPIRAVKALISCIL